MCSINKIYLLTYLLTHGLRSTSENCCHFTPSAAASRNATWISVTLGESYTSILCSDAAGFSGPELISDSQKDSENVCWGQISPHFNLFPGKMDFEFSVPKTKRTIQTFISNRSKRLSWYGVQQSKQHGWLAYVRRYYWHGGIYWRWCILASRWCLSWEVVNRSRQCQLSFCMCYNSMVS